MGAPVSAEDFTAVAGRMGAYCQAIDRGDAAAWAACFTEDGVFNMPGNPAKGREALTAFAKMVYEGASGRMRHLAGNLTCVYGDSRNVVIGRLYNFVTVWDGSSGRPAGQMALCTITFVRDGASWLIRDNSFEALI
jgi:uncharacterized protein (TIGR02246 family)